MSNVVYYAETQRFHQWWIWLCVLITPSLFSWILFQEIIFGIQPNDPIHKNYLLLIFIIAISITPIFLIYLAKLETEIRGEGLYIKFRPFHRKWVMLPFGDVLEASAISYRPLRDYGGWGIRYGSNSKAYNVSGNKGVLLKFSDGPDILIGSNNHNVLCSLINDMLR
jgi:hypothetical protein